MAGYDEFDPRAPPASSQSYESITVTTTASISMEDTYAVLEKPEPSSMSVLHRHEGKYQVCKEVEAVVETTYSRWDVVKESDLGVKEASFTITAVGELHQLLKADDKATAVQHSSCYSNAQAAQAAQAAQEEDEATELCASGETQSS